MVPKPYPARLCISMQSPHTNWQMREQPLNTVAVELKKEPKLKLSLETRNHGDVIIVYCQGRIVFRDEAIALSRFVGDALKNTSKVVLDLSGVSSIDSAGIGELALLQTWAKDKNAELKCSGATPVVDGALGQDRDCFRYF